MIFPYILKSHHKKNAFSNNILKVLEHYFLPLFWTEHFAQKHSLSSHLKSEHNDIKHIFLDPLGPYIIGKKRWHVKLSLTHLPECKQTQQ